MTLSPNAPKSLQSREFELVTKLARKSVDAQTEQRIRQLLSDELDFELFLRLVFINRVTPCVYRNLQRFGDAVVPETFLARIGERVEKIVSDNKRREAQLLEISREFDRVELPFLVVKGPVLANTIYGDPFLREYSDLDLLCDANDIEAATQLLNRFGFEREPFNRTEIELLRRYHFEFHLYNPRTNDRIDLHWALVPPRWKAKPSDDEIWLRAIDVRINDHELRTLNSEVLLLYLAVHASKDGWRRLRMLCDIAELLGTHPNWDWKRSLAKAEAWGCRRMLLISALLVDRLLDAPVPDDVLELSMREAEVYSTCERISQHLAIAGERKEKLSHIFSASAFQLRQFDRRRDRFLYTFQTLVTPRLAHVHFIRLPHSCISLYPAIKVLHDFILLPIWRLVRVKQPPSLD